MKYGKGLNTDTPHRKRMYLPAHDLIRSKASAPPSASLEKYECQILNQGNTSSCIGHGTVQCIVGSLASQNEPLGFIPSPRMIYTDARCYERSDVRIRLIDDGAMPSSVLRSLSMIGVRPMGSSSDARFSDVDDINVNNEPSLSDMCQQAQTLIAGQYAIDPTSDVAADQIKQSIASGYTLGVGMFVDTGFMDWGENLPERGTFAPKFVDMTDPDGGGHWLCANAYQTIGGVTILSGPNSWGNKWGCDPLMVTDNHFGGHWAVDLDSYLEQGVISDLIIFKVSR